MKSKQERIIDAAIDLFAEKGFAGTTTAQIANRSQVAQGTLFYHFKNKQGILYEVLRQILETTSSSYRSIKPQQLNGYACVEALLRNEMLIVQQHSKKVMVLIRDMSDEIHHNNSPSRQLIKAFLEFKIELLSSFLRKGIDDGSIRELAVEETAWFLDAAFYGVMHTRLIKHMDIPRLDITKLNENAINLCLTAIKA